MSDRHVVLNAPDGNPLLAKEGESDGLAATGAHILTGALAHGFGGTSWDRWRGNTRVVLLAGAQRAGTTASPLQVNHNARGALFFLRVTQVSGSGNIRLVVRAKDPQSGEMFDLLSGAAVTSAGWFAYELGPGASGTGGNVVQRVSGELPRDWDVVVLHADGSNYTYGVGALLVV
ncbi:MAG: hypothetical protein QHJ73_11580 [Armatimonadota bacterium]|nr:hypothetical protein [Armatimonadota bacterium]